MCGIAGIIDKRGKLGGTRLGQVAKEAADRMSYRGPDDSGVWVSPDGRCALAQRRLSIIDVSSAGHQPMPSNTGRSIITFNGEIYNFLELRRELEAEGAAFHSHSDTEVLVEILERHGPKVLPRLDAMFAFGHYDIARQELLLARDIFGEKPLYYVDHPDFFGFASELHALANLPGFDARIDRAAIASYLCFQYVPTPQTIYGSARKLPPASYLTVGPAGAIQVQSYYSFDTSAAEHSTRSIDDLADELEAILLTSLRRRLISDVPLGAFLSGGVDSSTVAALVTKKLGIPLQTFSIGFADHPDSEHHDAAEIARMLGTDHRDRVLSADAIELGHHIGTVLDEPNADSSCLPTYLLSGFAREHVTVALSGDGGDEMFGGYGRYFVTVDEWERKRKGDQSLGWWRAGEVYWSSRILVYPDDHLKAALGEIPAELAGRLAEMRRAVEEDRRPLLNVLREADARNYMPGAVLAKVDRMSMQHSLEVRAPLIGIEVADFAKRLAADDCYRHGSGKLILKRIASRYLPESWMNRPKRGFGLPMDLWSADKLLPITRALVLGKAARLPEWLDRGLLARYLNTVERDFNSYRVWSLYILENWLRSHPAVPAEAANEAGRSLAMAG
ncbi:MAG: putative Asparagine synthetase 1 [Microvirga sp.]|nr:putative Asparagine synthetase [glutamine-hydrolyzing] 1 [Geminicoccaceae bacterium]MDF2972377.1 putative Asparagine synthetase 1 [Microvirga sp.]